MQHGFGDAGQAHSAAGSTAVESELALLIDVYGLALLDEPERIHLRLVQACPDATRWIGAILAALRAQVPQRLRGAKNDENLPGVLQGAVQRVQEHGSLDAAWAAWAVRAWAHVLALPTAAIGPEASAATAQPGEPSGGPGSGAVGPDGTRAADARGSDRREPTSLPPQRPQDDVEERVERWPETSTGYGMPARATRRGGRGARREPVFERGAAAPDGRAAGAGGTSGALAAKSAAPVEPPSPYPDPAGIPAARPDSTARAASNDLSAAAASRSAGAAAPRPVAPLTAAGAPIVPPPFAPPQRARSKSFGRPILFGALFVAVALAIFFGANSTRRAEDSGGGTSSTTTARDTTPAVPPPARDTTPAVPPAGPEPSPAASAAPPKSDAPSTPATANPRTAERSAVPAAPAATSTATPQASVPVPAPPAAAAAPRTTIAQVDVPRVVEGDPFALAVRLRGDGRDVASIERRIVDSGGGWPEAEASTRRIAVPAGSTSVRVPFRAMDAPAYATLEFTAIGRDGSRSVPVRATVSVAGPTRGVADVPASGACTGSTCGTVTGSYEVSPDMGRRAAVYRIRVGMDDGQEQSFTAPYRLQNGSRVRRMGDRFVPDGSGAR